MHTYQANTRRTDAGNLCLQTFFVSEDAILFFPSLCVFVQNFQSIFHTFFQNYYNANSPNLKTQQF